MEPSSDTSPSPCDTAGCSRDTCRLAFRHIGGGGRREREDGQVGVRDLDELESGKSSIDSGIRPSYKASVVTKGHPSLIFAFRFVSTLALLAIVPGAVPACGGLPPGVVEFSADKMTAPVLIDSPPLKPPPEAVASGEEGVVEVACIITKEGTPEACHIEHDLPGGLGQAVLDMVKRQHYGPATKDGEPTSVRITLPFWVRRPLPPEPTAQAGLDRSPRGSAGKCGSGAPKVRMGATTVSGRLHPEIIQRTVRANFGRFRMCYERGLRKNRCLEGRVSVRFVINRSGYVVEASDHDSDLPDDEVTACVRSAFYGLVFPRPDAGYVSVIYPIMLAPGSAR